MRNLSIWAIVVLLASCNPGKEWKRRSVENKEKAVMDAAKKGKIDSVGLKDLLAAYDTYVTAYPEDTVCADYLFKEADFYRYMHKPAKSVAIYTSVYNNYPRYFRRPYCLFLQGFTYENDIRNMDSARVKYELFLSAYPNHPMAKDVKITLANLGKTPEQLMKEFEERQKTDSLSQSAK